jgi:hypothetical protein
MRRAALGAALVTLAAVLSSANAQFDSTVFPTCTTTFANLGLAPGASVTVRCPVQEAGCPTAATSVFGCGEYSASSLVCATISHRLGSSSYTALGRNVTITAVGSRSSFSACTIGSLPSTASSVPAQAFSITGAYDSTWQGGWEGVGRGGRTVARP